MGKYSVESGIQVLDRSISILHAVSSGPMTLAELCETTGIPRATTHRLATALETHQMLIRTSDGKWEVGPTLNQLAGTAPSRLISIATPIMATLVDTTGESVQLYQLTGHTRTCIAAQEPPIGLQNTVPVGSQLPLTHGSAARIFAAFTSLHDEPFSETDLDAVRGSGLAESVSEREVGLASVSAPIFDNSGTLVAALSVSGPAERLRPSPAAKWGKELLRAAERVSAEL
ncbi:IclR family transcriptional regulator [Corynebacterium lubricantis]|uniref:IclR family transcriptional regulator n=1 Tax=Corynebacterium lubricantis TaxID=541095 RepID=UPI000477EED2|nr:IclR family transcriptional regulator [Corynebacterium lubricantis]